MRWLDPLDPDFVPSSAASVRKVAGDFTELPSGWGTRRARTMLRTKGK
jgi:hypothetical protein